MKQKFSMSIWISVKKTCKKFPINTEWVKTKGYKAGSVCEYDNFGDCVQFRSDNVNGLVIQLFYGTNILNRSINIEAFLWVSMRDWIIRFKWVF